MRINEIFKSIQGETTHVGIPSVFVRTTGCNLRCLWCDTAYAFYEGREMTVEEVLEEVRGHQASHVVVTGGEPLLQEEVYPLFQRLIASGYTVLVETGGSLSVEEIPPEVIKILDLKCPGSGMTSRMDWRNLDYLTPRDEVKFVIENREDYEWAREVVEKHPKIPASQILFSPVHGSLDPAFLAEWILKDRLPVRLQLQIHKIIWGKDARGV
jgi:7-carboxy-7-deazaguanine synthase